MESLKAILLTFCFLYAGNIFCQDPITRTEETSKEDCKKYYAGLEIFKVVDTPPFIKSIDYSALEESLIDIVKRIRLRKDHKSIITLKLFFPIEGKPCLYCIELDGDILKDEKVQQLISPFENIVDFESGKQRNRSVICESIFDIIIKKGKLHDLQYSNVRFR